MSEAAAPIVLLHGAWHSAHCWHRLLPLLRASGRQVLAPTLPGHEAGPDVPERINFRSYTDAMSAVLEQLQEPAILVGHSMAGMLISALAESMPDKVACLVYLNAYIPCSGDSIFSLMALLEEETNGQQVDGENNTSISAQMQLSSDRRRYALKPGALENLFYNTSPREELAHAQAHYVLQPSLPLASRVKLSAAGFGQARKISIFSSCDRVIPPHLQRRMLRRQSCQEVVQLDTDHSPFASAPEALAAMLLVQ